MPAAIMKLSVVNGRVAYNGFVGAGDILASPGQNVKWRCLAHPYVIHVKGGMPFPWPLSEVFIPPFRRGQTPFDDTTYFRRAGQLLSVPVRANARRGIYVYGVAIFTPDGIITDDPRIIIN